MAGAEQHPVAFGELLERIARARLAGGSDAGRMATNSSHPLDDRAAPLCGSRPDRDIADADADGVVKSSRCAYSRSVIVVAG